MESKDQREGWIRELVKGSVVAVERFSLGNNEPVMSLVEVEGITPTGRVKANHMTFDQKGVQIIGDVWAHKRYLRSPDEYKSWTEKHLKRIERYQLLKKLEAVLSETKKLSNDQLERIIAIANEKEAQ